ncbi:hypothetical protein EC968_006416 [Mortierella alpina]|nr:hypothetical protein EC968_006416 [Mortierella alpina]
MFQRAPAAHNVNCVTLESLIGDPDLELMVQINYMIEVDFVMQRVHESLRDGLKTIVYHGLRYTQDQLRSQSSGLATCAFERDLMEYLRRYPQHEEITSRISQYDFTGVKGVLIGSVPGKFTGSERNKWGHLKLRTVLRQQVEIPRESVQSSKISSIGSLGKSSQDWLRGEFETSLNAHRSSNYMASGNADLCVVFPTADNVRTSANLSKPAWGELKDSTFTIKSYELGVLVFPGLYEDQADSGENLHVCMMNSTIVDPYPEPQIARSDIETGSEKPGGLTDSCDWGGYIDAIGVVPIRLPYDLPLTKYNFAMGDQVWLSDKFFPGQDDYGETLEH